MKKRQMMEILDMINGMKIQESYKKRSLITNEESQSSRERARGRGCGQGRGRGLGKERGNETSDLK